MEARLDFKKISPDVYKAMLGLEKTANASGLEALLLDLVRLRASQINGCAQCIDMHSKDLRAQGEDEQRLYLLNAWREAPFYTERERAALEYAEAMTCTERRVSVPNQNPSMGKVGAFTSSARPTAR